MSDAEVASMGGGDDGEFSEMDVSDLDDEMSEIEGEAGEGELEGEMDEFDGEPYLIY